MTEVFPLHQLLLARRSIRRYRPDPVPRALIDELLEAAIWAPSAHNRQPWRFAVLDGPQRKATLAQAMGAQLRADLTADHVPEDVIRQDVERSRARITQAPVVILLALSMVDMDVYSDAERRQHEWTMAVQSVAMAGQNLLLAAQARGLGACWRCAPLFCPEVVRATLVLPPDWQPQALITLGYPAETRTRTRVPVAARTLYLDDQELGSEFSDC